MKKVELCFRSVGERTSDLALGLALEHIRPDKLRVIENVSPFPLAVIEMLKHDFSCESVVFVDADCLILEDMRPFLNANTRPYVDCYVWDRFRGRVHCGVHITRLDVVRRMQELSPPLGERRFVLKPESYLRKLALSELGYGKEFKKFNILHDFGQYYRDIFCKYALRQLRSRKALSAASLELAMRGWPLCEPDFLVARRAVEYTRENLCDEQSPELLLNYLRDLPRIAKLELDRLGLAEKPRLSPEEAARLRDPSLMYSQDRKPKVFGIGLSRTGTKSLTKALQRLGLNVVHYPDDATTLVELESGRCDFSLLDRFDGITDITVAPYYAQLDEIHPGSKFILTLRDKAAWLSSMQRHYQDKPAYAGGQPASPAQIGIRRFLRAAVYGSYSFNARRMSYVYDQHLRGVREHFRERPEDLLEIDITAGQGWEKLCPFLGREVLSEPFPKVLKNIAPCLAEIPSGLETLPATFARQ